MLYKTIKMSIISIIAFLVLVQPVFADGHTENYCGNSITSRVIDLSNATNEVIYEDTAINESMMFAFFTVHSEAGACSVPEPITTYHNVLPTEVQHQFNSTYSKSTTFSASASASFIDTFEVEMGYSVENTATDSYTAVVDVPANTSVELAASTSLYVVDAELAPFIGQGERLTVYRPTGHIAFFTYLV